MKTVNLLKLNGVLVDEALEYFGDIETYNELLEEFLNVSVDRMKRLEIALDSLDFENYAIDVHAIKSDSKYLGFSKLADMALEHQLKAEEKNKVYILENYEDLVTEVAKIIGLVKEYLAK